MNRSSRFSEEKKEDGESSSSTKSITGDPNTSIPTVPSVSVLAAQPVKDDVQIRHPSKASNDERLPPFLIRLLGGILRLVVIDFPLIMLFAAFVTATIIHRVHDKYLVKQIDLMIFQDKARDLQELTYYHRYCQMDDEISATSTEELIVPTNATAEECVAHQMTHGASVYRDLLTPQTMHELREFIVEENKKQDGFWVIANEHRYSWGIDVNMHPAIKKYWKELGSNELLVRGIQAIVGPDPAIIEFTAITSSYGAKDQFDHQDVVAPGSGIKYAHSYLPSYSLFIPLQDTSYDMGATHVCPGSHLCAEGAAKHCPKHNIPMSGEDDKWPKGWGALVNQQTVHKGMGHTKKGGLDRVVIICTFASRPQTFRGLESRIIGQGGSYSIDWASWGHTFSDFVNADQRMWEPLKTMRALGLVKGHGWNLIHTASMRIANADNGYNSDSQLRTFQENGGLTFLPIEWQGELEENEYEEQSDPNIPEIPEIDNAWYRYLIGTVIRTERGLKNLYLVALGCSSVILLFLDVSRYMWTRRLRGGSGFLRGVMRVMMVNAVIVLLGVAVMHTIDQSNWAKDITAGRSYRLPAIYGTIDTEGYPSTYAVLPTESDVLIAPEYAAENLAGYGRVLDYAHPGNVKWNELVRLNGPGYLALSDDLQLKFCQTLLDFVHQDSRFLKQGQEREYLQIEDKDELFDTCHRDLVGATDPKIFEMMRQLNSLKTTAALGRFAKTAMQSKLSPQHIRMWEDVLVPRRSWTVKPIPGKPVSALKIRKRSPTISIARRHRVRRSSIQKAGEPQEPFPLAWIRERDVVEALFNCKPGFYYRAKVTAIIAAEASFDVEFDDGEFSSGLQRQCLRPFRPYKVDEEVQVRQALDDEEEDEDEWMDGTIMKITHEEAGNVLYDIEVEDAMILTEIKSSHIRRKAILPFKVGDRIVARYNDGNEWFPGIIEEVNKDGTYFVRYMDGDEEESVPLNRIRR